MVLKERALEVAKDFSPCQCGNKAKYLLGTVKQKVGDKTIIIHNVPHYYCSNCGSIGYDVDVRLTPILKYACLKNLSEVDYTNQHRY